MPRDANSAPGSPRITAMMAELSSDLIDVGRNLAQHALHLALLRATSSRFSARNSSTVGNLSPNSSRAMRCTRRTAASAVISVTTPSSSHPGHQLVAFLSPARRRISAGRPILPVVRYFDPNWMSCQKLRDVTDCATIARSSCPCQPERDPLEGMQNGPVAQRLELAAHNGLVAGSNPAGPTSGDGTITRLRHPPVPDQARLRDRALRYLARYATSEHHLAQVLRRKALPEAAFHGRHRTRWKPRLRLSSRNARLRLSGR